MLAYYKVKFLDAKKEPRVAHLHIQKMGAPSRRALVEVVLKMKSKHGFSSVKRITEEKR